MNEFRYRPEVDGLRALAVGLVLLFHAGLGFTGGYIGVDVFFVISGFLITGLILKEQDQNKFKLADFWVRRIRRILPAATAMVIGTVIIGSVVLLPSDFEALGESVLAQQLMISNFHFWDTTGYFGGPAELKPLLHTWSLAVEEQFYLFYPFFLAWAVKFPRKTLFWSLLGMAIFSLILSEVVMHIKPSTSFFLLPMRAWEMLAGGLIVFAGAPSKWKRWQLELASVAGVVGIFYGGWFYDSTTLFPGVSAILPCGSAMLIIYSNGGELTTIGKGLANRGMVFVGLLSYSLYLWHWPILALLRYHSGTELTLFQGIVAIAGSIVMAYLSWKFVETPFRKRRTESKPIRWISYTSAAVSTGIMLAIGGILSLSNGVSFRFDEKIVELDRGPENRMELYGSTAQEISEDQVPGLGKSHNESEKIDFVVWGDSHALALADFFDEVAQRENLTGAIVAKSGTTPLLGTWRPSRGRENLAWNDAVFDYIKRHQVRDVFLVSRWAVYLEGKLNGNLSTLIIDEESNAVTQQEAIDAMDRGFERTIAALKSSGARVWILEQVPIQAENPNKQIALAVLYGHSTPQGMSMEEHQQRQKSATQILRSHSSQDVHILAASKSFFANSKHVTLWDGKEGYYCDASHLSKYGAYHYLGEILEPIIKNLATTQSTLPPNQQIAQEPIRVTR